MEEYKSAKPTETDEISIFDDVKPLPKYYSEKEISAFSILFSVLFGAALLAVNIKNSPAKKGAWQVLLFGFLFTIMEGCVLSMIPRSGTGFAIAFNIGGAQILKLYFWPTYLGKEPYAKKPIWIPLAIALALIVLVCVILFAGL